MVIDGRVQLEPIEPASRALAARSNPGEDHAIFRDSVVNCIFVELFQTTASFFDAHFH